MMRRAGTISNNHRILQSCCYRRHRCHDRPILERATSYLIDDVSGNTFQNNIRTTTTNRHPKIRYFSSSSKPSSAPLKTPQSIMETYNAQEDHDHCVHVVQQRDREGYVCGLLMPSQARQAYFAIRALNVEIASIKDGGASRRGGASSSSSSENNNKSEGSSLALRMRIQWWRDAIEELYALKENEGDSATTTTTTSTKRNPLSLPSCWHNPVVRCLYYANNNPINNNSNNDTTMTTPPLLTRRFLERLVDAREQDLTIDQFATLDDATMYAEDTTSSLLYLSLECAGIQNDQADQVASHAGRGIGLTMALRSTIHRILCGELTIPADALSSTSPQPLFPTKYFMDRAAYSQQQQQEEDDDDFQLNPEYENLLRQGVENVAYVASSHLHKARELQHQVPPQGRSCLLPIVPNLHYLEQLQQCQYDLWDTQIAFQKSKFRTLALVGRAWMTGVF